MEIDQEESNGEDDAVVNEELAKIQPGASNETKADECTADSENVEPKRKVNPNADSTFLQQRDYTCTGGESSAAGLASAVLRQESVHQQQICDILNSMIERVCKNMLKCSDREENSGKVKEGVNRTTFHPSVDVLHTSESKSYRNLVLFVKPEKTETSSRVGEHSRSSMGDEGLIISNTDEASSTCGTLLQKKEEIQRNMMEKDATNVSQEGEDSDAEELDPAFWKASVPDDEPDAVHAQNEEEEHRDQDKATQESKDLNFSRADAEYRQGKTSIVYLFSTKKQKLKDNASEVSSDVLSSDHCQCQSEKDGRMKVNNKSGSEQLDRNRAAAENLDVVQSSAQMCESDNIKNTDSFTSDNKQTFGDEIQSETNQREALAVTTMSVGAVADSPSCETPTPTSNTDSEIGCGWKEDYEPPTSNTGLGTTCGWQGDCKAPTSNTGSGGGWDAPGN